MNIRLPVYQTLVTAASEFAIEEENEGGKQQWIAVMGGNYLSHSNRSSLSIWRSDDEDVNEILSLKIRSTFWTKMIRLKLKIRNTDITW